MRAAESTWPRPVSEGILLSVEIRVKEGANTRSEAPGLGGDLESAEA